MAVIKAVNSRASIGRAITYVTRTEKTEERLVSGIECSPQTAIEEMKATKAMWDKEDGRQYKHFVHSFPPTEKITPQQAHELTQALCQDRFKGYEVLIATHRDKDHIHSHIIVNSVGYENGMKLQWSKADLARMKKENDRLCREQGFSIPVKGQEITSNSQAKYKALERGITSSYKSYVLDCYNAATAARSAATSRKDFMTRMEQQGYKVDWQDSRKHITFTDRDGNKIRAANLEKTFKEPFAKEELEHGFERNAEAAAVQDRTAEPDRTVERAGAGQPLQDNDNRADGAAGERHQDDGRTGIDDLDVALRESEFAIKNTDATLDKSRDAISLDDSKRADPNADRESQQPQRDRDDEPEIGRGDDRSHGHER